MREYATTINYFLQHHNKTSPSLTVMVVPAIRFVIHLRHEKQCWYYIAIYYIGYNSAVGASNQANHSTKFREKNSVVWIRKNI